MKLDEASKIMHDAVPPVETKPDWSAAYEAGFAAGQREGWLAAQSAAEQRIAELEKTIKIIARIVAD